MSSPSTPQQPPNNPANKSIYEAAQLRSSLKIGGSLHRGTSSRRFLGTGGTGGSFRSSLRSSSTTATPSGGWPSASRTSRSSSFSSSSPAVAEFDVSRSAAYASSSHGSGHGSGYDSGTSYGSGSHPRSLPLPSSLRHSGRFTATTNSSSSNSNNSNHTKEVHHPYKNLQGISPSGNKLLCIRIPPEERAFLLGQNDDVEVELDRREIRMLARGGRLGDPIDDDLDVPPAHPSDDLDFNFDETTTTMMMNDGGGGGSRRMVSYPGEGRLHSIPIRYDHHDDDGIDDLQQRKERLKAAYRASSVRKGIFASILIFLTAASVFFTVENFIRVRTAQDWVEPRYAVGDYGAFGGGVVGASSSSASDGAGTAGNGNTALPNDSTVGRNQHQTPSYNVAQPQLPSSSSSSLLTPATATFQYDPDGTNGGIDWTTGPDAPPPHRSHSLLPPSLLTHLADWAAGTRRLSPSSTSSLETFPDGFGSIRVDPRIAFREIPFYWGESFGGGDIVSYALGGCLGLVLAADGGISGRGEREGLLGGGGFAPGSSSFSGSESTLLQQETNDSELSLRSILGRTYVNVDLSTVEGIEQASNWKLASSGMADVVVSPHLNHIAEKVLDGQHKGRIFVLLIHPCVREFRRFRHWRKMELLHHGKGLITNKYSEEGNEDILSMSYTAYSKSHLVEDNWMTRTILDKPTESYPELTVEDMHAAKELLRTKAIIGLYDDILGAIRHYSRYFGWDGFGSGETIGERAVKCFEKSVLEGMKREDEEDELMTAVIASGSGLNQESLETPFITAQEEETREGSMAWENILERNRFDLELYLYGQKLYSYQVGLN